MWKIEIAILIFIEGSQKPLFLKLEIGLLVITWKLQIADKW